MSLDWSTFQANLSKFGNISVMYINNEGNEIPIDSECEFQEALRLAKENEKNHLQLILIVNDSEPTNHETVNTDGNEKKSVISVKGCDKTKLKSRFYNIKIKESNCLCKYGTPPEWFINYMEKFKEDLISEMKGKIDEAVQNIEKDKKSVEVVKINDVLPEDKNNLFSSEETNMKTNEKSEEDSGNYQLLDKKEVESSRNFRFIKQARLEFQLKLNDKEETIHACEENHKPEIETVVLFPSSKSQKSASIVCNATLIRFRPENKFTIRVDIKNNGKLPWEAPRLEVQSPEMLFVDCSSVELFKLSPSESCSVTLEVKLESEVKSEEMNFYFIDLRVMDGSEFLTNSFCFAKVDSEEMNEELSSVIGQLLNNDQNVNDLINFRRNVILNSQKKIDQNIVKIEKRLQEINLLRKFIELDTLAKEIKENEHFPNKEDFPQEVSEEFKEDFFWDNFLQLKSVPDITQIQSS